MGFVAAIFLLAGAGLAAECRTELGVQCYTVIATNTQWQLFQAGLTDVQNFSGTMVRALRADGSRLDSHETSSRVLLGASTPIQRTTSLYLAPTRKIVTVNHSARTIARRDPHIWHDLPYRRSVEGDSACLLGIRHFGGDFTHRGPATVAGLPVVKWDRKLENSGIEEIYMAPAIDCIPVKTYSLRKNTWGVPVLVNKFEASEIRLGQPSADLFMLPASYQDLGPSDPSPLLRFMNQQPILPNLRFGK